MRFVKPLIILSCVLLFVSAKAQQEPIYASNKYLPEYHGLSLKNFNNNLLEAKAISSPFVLQDAPGQRMIRVGKTLTIAGSVLIVGGVILMATADELYYRSNTVNGQTVTEGDIKGGLGVVMTAGGVGMVVPGIIVWSIGRKKYRASQAGSASVSLGINNNGGGLRYTF